MCTVNKFHKLNCNYIVQREMITNLLNNIVSTYAKNKQTVNLDSNINLSLFL